MRLRTAAIVATAAWIVLPGTAAFGQDSFRITLGDVTKPKITFGAPGAAEGVEELLARRREAYGRVEGLLAAERLEEAVAPAEEVRRLERAILDAVSQNALADAHGV